MKKNDEIGSAHLLENKQFQTIRFERVRQTAIVTLNRPEVRNAFHPSMIRELTEAFTHLSRRTDLSVVVLRGEGKSFCSGADLNYMKSMADFSFEENRQDALELWTLFQALHDCPQPIVGRIHGHAMGGAVGLAALCDVTAAVSGTQFCFSEVRLGIAPAVISPFVLEKMNASQAKRYMLTAEIFSAEDAREAGLVQFVGDEAAVDAFVEKTVETLSHNGPAAMRATKNLLRRITETPNWSDRMNLCTQVIAERRVSAEGQEGLRGFLEKRAPSWRAMGEAK